MGLVESMSSGDHLASLEALRNRLASDLDACTSAKDAASLAGQIRQVLAEIEAIKSKQPANVSAVDEIAARRKARRKPLKDGSARESS